MAKDRADEQILARSIAEAARRTADKLDDAAAHALAALTETLRKTPEGRPTAARIRRSRSYQAALNRLDELLDDLVEIAERFRAEHYRQAYAFWHGSLPPDVLRDPSRSEPPQALVRKARTALVLGYSTRRFLGGRIESVKGQLLPILTVASNRATTKGESDIQLKRWASSGKSSIAATATSFLVSSQSFCDRLAGRDCIQAERLHPDPSLSE